MKKLMMLCCLVILGFMVCGSAVAGTVTLQWSPSTGADGYYVYTDGAKGVAVTGTTSTVTVPAGAHSFFVTAYNAWGESQPSNTVTTPPLVTSPTNVKITVFVDVVTGE